MKLIIALTMVIVIVSILSFLAWAIVQRLKPVPVNRDLEEARAILGRIALREELLPSLPDDVRAEIFRFMNNKRRK